jgi:hypothetical protein
MKESLRRVILFTVIVVTGSVMILFDVPLIILIPLILITGVIVLVLLGAITRSDIRSAFRRPKFKNLKKIGVLKRLDEVKFFEKKPQRPVKKAGPVQKKEEEGLKPQEKTGPSSFRSFFSSIGSLGSVLKERKRQKKKVEHINELLDKAVSEKPKGSALAGAGKNAGSGTGIPGGGGGGSGTGDLAKEQDPFMSLSGDEFDVSLLDGLEDTGLTQPVVPDPGKGPAILEPDIPLPPLDIKVETDDILKDNAAGLEEFRGLEGGESIDQDFSDLDSLDLDSIDLDIDLGEDTPETGGNSSPEQEKPGAPPSGAVEPVKTTWIASDAPRDAGAAGDQISINADMSAFAKGASASDEDMLSSLASEVKQVKKERNLSLIRDLKDFRASATEIEDELRTTCERLKVPVNQKEKGIPSAIEKK